MGLKYFAGLISASLCFVSLGVDARHGRLVEPDAAEGASAAPSDSATRLARSTAPALRLTAPRDREPRRQPTAVRNRRYGPVDWARVYRPPAVVGATATPAPSAQAAGGTDPSKLQQPRRADPLKLPELRRVDPGEPIYASTVSASSMAVAQAIGAMLASSPDRDYSKLLSVPVLASHVAASGDAKSGSSGGAGASGASPNGATPGNGAGGPGARGPLGGPGGGGGGPGGGNGGPDGRQSPPGKRPGSGSGSGTGTGTGMASNRRPSGAGTGTGTGTGFFRGTGTGGGLPSGTGAGSRTGAGAEPPLPSVFPPDRTGLDRFAALFERPTARSSSEPLDPSSAFVALVDASSLRAAGFRAGTLEVSAPNTEREAKIRALASEMGMDLTEAASHYEIERRTAMMFGLHGLGRLDQLEAAQSPGEKASLVADKYPSDFQRTVAYVSYERDGVRRIVAYESGKILGDVPDTPDARAELAKMIVERHGPATIDKQRVRHVVDPPRPTELTRGARLSPETQLREFLLGVLTTARNPQGRAGPANDAAARRTYATLLMGRAAAEMGATALPQPLKRYGDAMAALEAAFWLPRGTPAEASSRDQAIARAKQQLTSAVSALGDYRSLLDDAGTLPSPEQMRDLLAAVSELDPKGEADFRSLRQYLGTRSDFGPGTVQALKDWWQDERVRREAPSPPEA